MFSTVNMEPGTAVRKYLFEQALIVWAYSAHIQRNLEFSRTLYSQGAFVNMHSPNLVLILLIQIIV